MLLECKTGGTLSSRVRSGSFAKRARTGIAAILATLAAGCSGVPRVLAPGEEPERGCAVAVYALHLVGEGGERAETRAWRGRPIFHTIQSRTFRHGGRDSLEGERGAPVAFAFAPGRFVLSLEEVDGIPVESGIRSVAIVDRPALVYLGDIYVLIVEKGVARREDAALEHLRADTSPIESPRASTRRLQAILDIAIVDDARRMEERLRRERPEIFAGFESMENRTGTWTRGGSRGWSIELGKARPLPVRSSPPPWAPGESGSASPPP